MPSWRRCASVPDRQAGRAGTTRSTRDLGPGSVTSRAVFGASDMRLKCVIASCNVHGKWLPRASGACSFRDCCPDAPRVEPRPLARLRCARGVPPASPRRPLGAVARRRVGPRRGRGRVSGRRSRPPGLDAGGTDRVEAGTGEGRCRQGRVEAPGAARQSDHSGREGCSWIGHACADPPGGTSRHRPRRQSR